MTTYADVLTLSHLEQQRAQLDYVRRERDALADTIAALGIQARALLDAARGHASNEALLFGASALANACINANRSEPTCECGGAGRVVVDDVLVRCPECGGGQ